jgi:hypothetical protein
VNDNSETSTSSGKPEGGKTRQALAPDAVVKNFYAAHDAGRSPFFQSKNRALVDRYFHKELADLIWKDAVCQQKNGGICNLDFNVPYATNGGDRQDASQFKIGKPEYGEGNRELADVPVTFKLFATKANPGETITILYRLEQGKAKDWKISDIYFPGNDESSSSLKSILSGAAADSEGGKIRGELQTGKAGSVILYFGEESGDYAGYCFKNDSEVGRAILARCKNGEQCEFVGEVDGEAACKVPGLEADLSASGNITKVTSVKSLGRKK